MTHKPHSFLHAVKKMTGEVKALGRERVLPWYEGKGKGMEKHNFSGVHRLLVSFVSFNFVFSHVLTVIEGVQKTFTSLAVIVEVVILVPLFLKIKLKGNGEAVHRSWDI